MSERHRLSVFIQFLYSREHMPVSSAPAYDQQVGISITLYLHLRYTMRYIIYFCLTGTHHFFMIHRIGRYRTRPVILFKTSQAMHKTFRSRLGPETHLSFLITNIRFPSLIQQSGLYIIGSNVGIFIYIRDTPCRRAVTDKPVGQENNGRHMFQCNLSRMESHIETICRSGGGHNYQWTLAVPAVQSL